MTMELSHSNSAHLNRDLILAGQLASWERPCQTDCLQTYCPWTAPATAVLCHRCRMVRLARRGVATAAYSTLWKRQAARAASGSTLCWTKATGASTLTSVLQPRYRHFLSARPQALPLLCLVRPPLLQCELVEVRACSVRPAGCLFRWEIALKAMGGRTLSSTHQLHRRVPASNCNRR